MSALPALTSNTPRLIRRPAVQAKTAVSRSRIYALIKQGKFPKPIQLGAMSVAWIESEIDLWIQNQIEASRKVGV